MEILQVWQSSSGSWNGRVMKDGAESGLIEGCTSKEGVEADAIRSGLKYSKVVELICCPAIDDWEEYSQQ